MEAYEPSEFEDSGINVPLMNPIKKRAPSLFEAAERSLKKRKCAGAGTDFDEIEEEED